MAQPHSMAPHHERTIAPAPARNGDSSASPAAPQTMPYTCQTCSRRKVKCDKAIPVCSTCRKSRLECAYQAPLPRKRKRKTSEDLNDKLTRYESVLSEHGLIDKVNAMRPEESPAQAEPQVSVRLNGPETARIGKLVSDGTGKARYIDSNLWRTLGEEEVSEMYEDEDETSSNDLDPQHNQHPHDPLTGALLGRHQPLSSLHPPPDVINALWSAYASNVDPICRVLHTPSMASVVEMAARNTKAILKPLEALLFSVYHFAIVSMSPEECLALLREPQNVVQPRFRHATCQALVNAGFLKTSELQVLQAYVLFLLAVRTHYDPHTFWILSGVAFRIGQRMGLHRDGEILGLPPFEVQMRRRLFWQLLPMDGIAAQISGTGIAPAPDSWDTKQPLNLNEDQIWPGMTEQPVEQVGATDMIFCIARTEVGKFHNKTKTALRIPDYSEPTPQELRKLEAEDLTKRIEEMEDLLERKIVRYCDIVDPLHFLTISLCRGAMSVIRLRVKISISKHQPMSKENMREVYRLAMKVIDYDTSVVNNIATKKFLWHFRALFQHSSLACALTSLRNPIFLEPHEVRTAWDKIGKLYGNHPELMEQKGALHIAMARLTLKSWDASAYNAGILNEPPFIAALRNLRRGDKMRKQHRQSNGFDLVTPADTNFSTETSPESQGILTGLSADDLNVNYDFSLDNMDWMNWDKMMAEFQASSHQTMLQMGDAA